jgi:hypothetical protein
VDIRAWQACVFDLIGHHRRDRAARAYLEVIAREPDAVRRALARAAKAA